MSMMETQFEVGTKVKLAEGRPEEPVGVITSVVPQMSGRVTQEVWVRWPAELYGRSIEVNYWIEDLVIVNECEEQQ